MSEDKGRPLPKFGEWDVNDPASAEGFTVIFNKARDEKKTGGKPESPAKANPHGKSGGGGNPGKPQSVRVKNGFAAYKDHRRNLDEVRHVYELPPYALTKTRSTRRL